MSQYDEAQFRDDVRSYANTPDNKMPYSEWVHNDISAQLMWMSEDEIDVVVEVLESYDDYDEIDHGDEITNAPGELAEIGLAFVDALEDALNTSITLTMDEEGTNHQMVTVKLYRQRVQI